MTITTITGPVDDVDDRHAAEVVAAAILDKPVDRVAELKRELADELSRQIQRVETDLAYVDAELEQMTERRKCLAADLRGLNAELQHLTGHRPAKKDTAEPGEHACHHPGCGKTFTSKQGLTMHNTRTHKPGPISTPPKPTPTVIKPVSSGASTRTVYRCGALTNGDPCNEEFRELRDLSHHTLTAHRRQPTAAEKILVTPDR